jgi:four helix bundle protein
MFTSFKEMPVWQKAVGIAETIQKCTDHLPRKEDYDFTSQIRRASLSISANIAEAYGRHHTLDKINFYYIARGSLTETQSHLEYGRQVNYITDEDARNLEDSLLKLLHELNRIIVKLKDPKISEPEPQPEPRSQQ